MPILEALTVHGPLRPGSSQIAIDRFIVVAPQLPVQPQPLKNPAVWSEYEGAVRRIVEEVQLKYNGDPKRTYLTGFSYGGNGALDFASDEGRFWAARWPVDPTRVPARDPQGPILLSRGPNSRDQNFIELLNLRPLEEDPHSDRVYSDEGENHGETAISAYKDTHSRIYEWLLKKQL